jgi:broad specificity polyphosphatase/5'/3'-nucleotidase SurE
MGYKVPSEILERIKKHLVAVDKSIDTTGININIPSSRKTKKLKTENEKLIKLLEDEFYIK